MSTRYTTKRFKGVLVLATIALLVSGCNLLKKPQANVNANINANANVNANSNSAQKEAMMEAEAMAQAKPFVLKEQNNSGQSGTVKIFDVNGKAKVVLSVTGGLAEVEQPAHIHTGSCATLGGVKYGLNNVINGNSETMLDVSTATILSNPPVSVNVHKSNAEVSVYVGCIELTGSTMMDKDGTGAMNVNVNAGANVNVNANVNTNLNLNANVSVGVKTFTVSAANFAYDVKEIRVKKGDTVKINFKNDEGFHDWILDEFDARTSQLQTGGSQTIQFTADTAGTFEYYCSVGQHRQFGMVGKLIVE